MKRENEKEKSASPGGPEINREDTDREETAHKETGHKETGAVESDLEINRKEMKREKTGAEEISRDKAEEMDREEAEPVETSVGGGLRRFYPLLVFLIFIAFTLSNLWWLKINQSPPIGGEPLHLIGSYRALADLKDGKIGDFLFPAERYYPPLVLQCSSIFYLIIGRSHTTAVMSQVLFWFILIFSAYLIGSRLFGPEAGLLAALASVICPGNSTFLGKYLLDIPLAAMIALSFYLLLKSERFTNKMWTYLFFAACGTGMLVKWTFALFMAPAFLYTVGNLLYEGFKGESKRKDTILNLVTLLASAAVISLE